MKPISRYLVEAVETGLSRNEAVIKAFVRYDGVHSDIYSTCYQP